MGSAQLNETRFSCALRRIGEAFSIVLIALAVILGAELVARRWVPYGPPDDVLAGRAAADVYAGETWAPAYFREFGLARRTSWHSYVYWRRQPFRGTYITIDANGLRRTWVAPEGHAPARKVFFFGGSVVWGEGARDEHTIPSLLAKALAANGLTSLQVTNFAESGYVTMQEVVQLEDELRRGNIPDVAIFLDGVNDLFTARQNGVPGLPQNESKRIREFNIDADGRIYREAVWTFLSNTALYRALVSAPAPPTLSAAAIDALATDTVRLYLETIELARRLGSTYGFDPLFYWQPLVFTKAKLSPWERKIAQGPEFREFYTRSYARVPALLRGANHVRDLSDLFAQDPEPRYIDFCHLGEKGNEILANAIAPDVTRVLTTRGKRTATEPAAESRPVPTLRETPR